MGFYKSFSKITYKDKPKPVYFEERTPKCVELMRDQLAEHVVRPQILIKDARDYYIAKDTLKKTEYICFKNLMMLDIDFKDSYMFTDTFIKNYFNSIDNMCFVIHKSKNGYHVFVVSKKFDYTSRESVRFMLENFCDFYYCCFSYIRGYSVRLSPKEGEERPIYTSLGLFGNLSLLDRNLLKLVSLIPVR